MNEVRNGEQKEQKYLYFETFYGGQKLHKYFRSLLIKYTSLVSVSANCVTSLMGSELELRLSQSLTNLAKFQQREKSSDLPS